MKIMASGPITSWQIDGEMVETVKDFSFLGSKITADGACSHKILKGPSCKLSHWESMYMYTRISLDVLRTSWNNFGWKCVKEKKKKLSLLSI